MARYPAPKPLFPIVGPITGPLDMIPIVNDRTGRGERAWSILSRLPITEGEHAGKLIGENAPPWMPRLTRLLFGHVDQDGRRLIREAFLSIGKKNAKSAYAAALATTKALLDEEQREHSVCLAAKRDQARIAFDSIVAMVHADAELAERCTVVDHKNLIRYGPTSSRITAISAELASLVGFNPSFAVVDELHLLGATPKGAKLVNQIRTGSVSRAEPMLISISTAPTDRSTGIFEATLAKARRVIAGTEIDPTFFAWICEIPDDVDKEDPANWHWSNPSLGYTVTLDRLIAMAKSAETDPEALRDFRSQNLNIQPDESAGAGKWLTLAQWDAAADPSITLEAVLTRSAHLYVGIDAGGLDDLSAIALLGRTEDDEFMLWTHQWLSRQGYEKRKRVVDYDAHIAAEELDLFEDGSADIEAIAQATTTAGDTGKLSGVGIDSYGAVELAAALEGCGAELVSVPQSWKLTPAISWIERQLADGALKHSGGALMRWNIGNAVVTRAGNARSISKATVVGAGKIDGVAAMLNAAAVCVAARATEAASRSIWDDPNFYEATRR